MSTIYVADLHSDKKRKVTYGNASIWNKKPLQILRAIIRESNPEKLVLLGDVFDTAVPDSLSFASFVIEIIDVQEVWIIEGNHDRPKLEKEYAFQKLNELPNVTIVPKNTLLKMWDGNYGIGWCDTQEIFESKVKEAIKIGPASKLCLHCNWDDWGNEMDNAMTPQLYRAIQKAGILVLAGHEHAFHQEDNFIHLGAVMPMTIAEIGPKYFYRDDKLVQIDHKVGATNDCEVLLLREEPDEIIEGKAYYVKTGKEVTIEDIQMEAKDLKVDILSDFVQAAKKAGFEEGLLMEFIDDKEN